MMELAYDIASGANYKFNTATIGEEVRLTISTQLSHYFNQKMPPPLH